MILLSSLFFFSEPVFAGKLHEAARSFDEDEIIDLIQKGSRLNEKDKEGKTPLHLLVETGSQYFGSLDVISVMVQAGADINARNNNNETPLLLYLKINSSLLRKIHFVIVKKLVDSGAHVNVKSKKEGYFPLYFAPYWRYSYAITELLIQAGADANLTTRDGKNTLFAANALGDVEIARLLIKAGADVNVQDHEGKTLLMFLLESHQSFYSHTNLIQLLLESGARINDQDEDGKTALIYAAATGNIPSCQFLLQAGAKPQIMDESGKTALDYALEKRHYSIIYYLQKALTSKNN